MLPVLLLAAVLSGPLPYAEVDDYHPTVYLVVDTKSKNKDVVRASKLVATELNTTQRGFFDEQRFFINAYYDIKIVEYEDLRFPTVPSLPCFRFGKHSSFEPFLPGTFQASGTFTLSLYTILRWDNYREGYGLWLVSPKHIIWRFVRRDQSAVTRLWLGGPMDIEVFEFPGPPAYPDVTEAFPAQFDWQQILASTSTIAEPVPVMPRLPQ